jgi:hypothetical protein
MTDEARFVRLLLDRPDEIIAAVAVWLRRLSDELRARACDEDAVQHAVDTIVACPDGNPALLITRPVLPAAINMAVPPGTPAAVFVEQHVVPFIAAQRVLSQYQMTACNMQAAECNQLLVLVDLLDQAPQLDRVCQQYLVLQLVFADVLPSDLLPRALRPFLSLYSVFGTRDAYTPTGVTHRLVAILAAWLASPAASSSAP